MAEQVRMFRCSICGKWSHAKKQPKKHARWVNEGEPGFDESRVAPAYYDHLTGYDESPAGHQIDCGPLIPYIAHPER
jgi:hypothetical protein